LKSSTISSGKRDLLLNEILIRVKALQDSLDMEEIENILSDAENLEALREAEEDVKSSRERDLRDLLADLRKAK